MDKTIIAEGKTTAEAVEKGLAKLNVSKDKVEIKVLEETEKRSFYSILNPRVVKVELTLKDGVNSTHKEKQEHHETHSKSEHHYENTEKRPYNQNEEEIKTAAEDIKEFLKEFFKGKEIESTVKVENFDIYIDIQGSEVNHLIGYRGETINALQVIISSIANKKSNEKIKIFVDIAGYRDKRVKTLEELAEKIAKTVIRTGKPITLEPMTAYERKIIHTKLQEHKEVQTLSKGEEPYRKIIITLK